MEIVELVTLKYQGPKKNDDYIEDVLCKVVTEKKYERTRMLTTDYGIFSESSNDRANFTPSGHARNNDTFVTPTERNNHAITATERNTSKNINIVRPTVRNNVSNIRSGMDSERNTGRVMSNNKRTKRKAKKIKRRGCSYCGEINHNNLQCGYGYPISCYNCGKQGHKQKHCFD